MVDYYDGNPLDKRIGVSIAYDEKVTLREGYAIRIAEFTMLGGRVIEIDPGPFGSPNLPPNSELKGAVTGAALAAIGAFLEDNRDDVEQILANIRKSTDDIASGQGLLGALLTDTQMRDDATSAIQSVKNITLDIQEGTGVLGMLISDSGQRDRLLNMLEETEIVLVATRKIVEDLEAGRGAFGAMLQDENMRERALSITDNLAFVSSRVRLMVSQAEQGHGILGRILSRENLAIEAEQFIHDLALMTRKIAEGEGSVGKFLMEAEAYDEMILALRSLNGQLEDAREAQPVSSFAQMLLGGL
jgi:phospholipid/cholesterol/gamma-HCH transport system substrate-binding protein